jgi:hypothetical protein
MIMPVLLAFLTVLLISNAVLFIGLAFLRQARPDLRTRLFSWTVHNGTHRRSGDRHHSGLPA